MRLFRRIDAARNEVLNVSLRRLGLRASKSGPFSDINIHSLRYLYKRGEENG